MDCLGLNDEKFGPRISLYYYRALIYRKTYRELSDIIDKSKEIFKKVCPGASYNNTKMIWFFPSGAQIQFTSMDTIEDCDKIQGKEYQYICCEEIGAYNSDKVMRYCLSRLRSSHGLKCYFRATCNPSRFKWLRNTFKINALGESTKFYVETDIEEDDENGDKKTVKKLVEYISATLSDNPHLGSDYRAQLMMLPEDERNALLYGRWDAYDSVDGAIYKKEISKMYSEKRYCKVQFLKDSDYYAAFDLGRNDTTAIILFHMVNGERHIFDYYENNGEDINFYIDWLKEKKYENAIIILPHDANQHRIEFKFSVFETVSKSFKKVKCLERISIEEGIDCARRMFDKVYFSKDHCERLIECLTSYRRRYNAALDTYTDPVHDTYSNGADAFRYMCLVEPVKKYDFKMDNVFNTSTI